ncbi:hypothetical protein KPP03845_102727 [Streptomyces xanthophaeus]|uniref:hypothetical protein n=1 Tax=Streptomyces xanthophaeus TaxID=67385 RepID=UPI00233EB6F3|nr:hypothetical protein [Streptomyces xanthophaeus]WCD86381.1 hypothetical protein KPP03845_102727 [Streptomyces xanthophaeus]
MSTPTEARTALDTARTEAAQAAELIEALAERVRDGDDDVTAEQIATQRQLAELAELRVTGAERKLAAAETADRDARAKAIAAAARKLLDQDDMQPLLDAVRSAVTALGHLVDVTTARTERIHTLAVQAVEVNEDLKRADPAAGPWPSSAYGFRAQTFPAHVAVMGEGNATAVRPGRMAAAVLAFALDGNRSLAAEAREVFNAPFAAVIERLMAEVPGLDAVLSQQGAPELGAAA